MTLPSQRQIPLLDLRPQHQPIHQEILAEIARVIDSQKFIMGDDVRLLEKAVAEYCAVPHAIACGSGSDALYLALLATGIKHGAQVLTTPFSFFATAGSISRAGATPVFADIQYDTFNIDPNRLTETIRFHPRTRAIIPVHLFGGCADLDPIMSLARERGCVVIEDGAQSIGAEYNGRKAQSIGDVGCISFFPSKNLGAFGDGGMMTTKDADLAKKLASLRLHGTIRKYHHEWIGTNSRLDTLQAAILRVKLRHLDSWTEARQNNAALYRRILSRLGAPLTLPQVAPYQTRHVYNQFVVRCPNRDALRDYLKQHGVATEVYYPLPLHLQPCYKDLGYREGDFPVSEQAAREVLALPVHPGLSAEDIEYICHLVRSFYALGS